MKQYAPENVSRTYDPFSASPAPTTVTVGASLTSAISREFPISYGGSRNIVVAAKVTALTVGSGVTLALQSSVFGTSGDEEFITAKSSAAVAATGWVYIRMNVENTTDQATMPLSDVGRVVAITTAGASVTVSDVLVLQAN